VTEIEFDDEGAGTTCMIELVISKRIAVAGAEKPGSVDPGLDVNT
jgi:hypothetical protein